MTTNDTPPAWATFTNDDMHAAGLETVAAEMERDAARRECDRLRAENAELREHMNLDRQAVIALRQREEQARAQVADLADKLHKANADNASLTKAGTAWANEVADLRRQGIWEAPAEPTDVTAIRDRHGRTWMCPGRPGNNLWWVGQLGAGIGHEWHELLHLYGPLTAATEAEVA